ncbi:hypothetical protein [Desulfosporosinus nitroreducens]|uniref:Uncharacterized protein n=1 Tax=Desulfosporosinus nitroreducens TaxID=2018668 RepID=A0ABT8QU87_9FIRM|nr:hypothetical protein [Desulfosporosinus nitroreducens]MDO0824922.1 hypothetical protein [Desulfosporosinus nitroreducens]
MGKAEQKINSFLQKFPVVKNSVKRVYQLTMYAISPKLKSSGEIQRITPNDECEYFFGYYDKCPWDATGRYMLCNRVKNAYAKADNSDEAQLVLIDTKENNKCKVIATTHSWNVQQGCMLQWLGTDYASRVIYNDFRNGNFCSVILELSTSEEKVLPMPVYSVAPDSSFALTLDFARLHRLRPGYGYSNAPEVTANELCPNKPCIWKVNLSSGKCEPLFKYTDFAALEIRPEMVGAEHKVNHLMIAPDGKRFMVLHRWFVGSRKYTRLVTANCDGTGLYNLLDDDFVSHCFWKNSKEILTFAEKKEEGRGYFLLHDSTKQVKHLWPALVGDGHPSYSSSGQIVTDNYPDRRRVAKIYVLAENSESTPVVAQVFAPFRYDNDVRCDLHPRWSRGGDKVCFDSVFEGKRELYIVKIGNM